MKVMITSFRGDHNAVLEPEVSQVLFEKLTGKRTEALPADLKTKVPDTFQELEGLWRDGKLGYSAFVQHPEDGIAPVKEFNPEIEDLLFIAPQQGG